MSNDELIIRGVYFRQKLGQWIESHTGTPGVEIRLGETCVFVGYKEASVIAKTIERLGTTGANYVTVQTRPKQPGTGVQVQRSEGASK